MRKIVIVSAKGGTGKTTVTMLLAMAFEGTDIESGVIDLDPQGSASNWIDYFEREGKPIPQVEKYRKGGKYDIVWVDTPPVVNAKEAVKKEVKQADRVLVVTSDSPMDIHATRLTIENLLTTPALKKKARLLFTRVKKGTGLSKTVDEVSKIFPIKRMKPIIHDRNCYREATTDGWRALTADAKNEVNAVVKSLHN